MQTSLLWVNSIPGLVEILSRWDILALLLYHVLAIHTLYIPCISYTYTIYTMY